MPNAPSHSQRRWSTRLLVTVLVAAAAGAGWWAGRTVTEPPDDPLAGAAEPVTYQVQAGTVGRSLDFAAVAEWSLVPLGLVGGPGVVTSVAIGPGDEVRAGDVVFTLDLRPVVVAEGTVPAFRSLALRDVGADVAQLQAMLVDLGFSSIEPDGVFGTGTRTAVREWQRSLGTTDDGVVRAGDVVFVPDLPARVALGEGVTVGARLGGGETALLLVPDAPAIRIPLAIEQRPLVPLAAEVFVRYPEGAWDARIDQAVEDEFGGFNLVLSGPDGGSVCGDDCTRWVSLVERTSFGVEVVVIPRTEGPVVPVAAVTTDPAGAAFVTLGSGEERRVDVVASWGGTAVVEGVEVGEVIVLPFAGESP